MQDDVGIKYKVFLHLWLLLDFVFGVACAVIALCGLKSFYASLKKSRVEGSPQGAFGTITPPTQR